MTIQTALTTIHVALSLKGKPAKRPLRVYDATHFGVVVAGECHAVEATGPKAVKLLADLPAKPKDACPAAKLADLGIAKKTPPATAPAMDVAQMIAMLQAAGFVIKAPKAK